MNYFFEQTSTFLARTPRFKHTFPLFWPDFHTISLTRIPAFLTRFSHLPLPLFAQHLWQASHIYDKHPSVIVWTLDHYGLCPWQSFQNACQKMQSDCFVNILRKSCQKCRRSRSSCEKCTRKRCSSLKTTTSDFKVSTSPIPLVWNGT